MTGPAAHARRWLTAAGAAGVLLAVVVASGAIEPATWQGDGNGPATFSVASEPQPVACPGPVVIPVGDIDADDPLLDPGSDIRTRTSFGGGVPTPVGNGTAFAERAVTSVERVESGDVSGLAAVACPAPSRDQWLVGGSTQLGDSARLLLMNPTRSAAQVEVTLYGELGEVEQRVIATVGAGAQESLFLEGIETGLGSLVVHVESTGVGVVALLQDSRLDGFLPEGTDWVAPLAGPASHVVVPGVLSTPLEGAGAATLRLMAPDGATVSLALVGVEGIVAWPGTRTLVLDPGVVVDLRVPASEWASIEVTADAPVLAAASSSLARTPDEGLEGDVARDLAWAPAFPVDGQATRAAVVADAASLLVVYSPTNATFVARDAVTGDTLITFPVSARSTSVLPVTAAPGTVILVDGSFAWSLVMQELPGFLAILAPVQTTAEQGSVTVQVGGYVP